MNQAERPPMRLGPAHERWVYAICGLAFLSGAGWLIDHYLFAPASDFGEAHAPAEPWWLRAHGAAAMACLIILGTLLPGHIARAWKLRRNHLSGLGMLAFAAVLIVTGYGLYYSGDEDLRPWISLIHWITGLVAIAGLFLHVVLGKRPVKRAGKKLSQGPRDVVEAR